MKYLGEFIFYCCGLIIAAWILNDWAILSMIIVVTGFYISILFEDWSVDHFSQSKGEEEKLCP